MFLNKEIKFLFLTNFYYTTKLIIFIVIVFVLLICILFKRCKIYLNKFQLLLSYRKGNRGLKLVNFVLFYK